MSSKVGVKLAPYNPTNIDAIHTAIRMLQIQDSDVIYDLGCGDGRFLIEVCKLNPDFSRIKCFGIEYDHDLCCLASKMVDDLNFNNRIQIIHDNVLNVNFTEDATVLFIYLVPEGMLRLKESLIISLNKGARILTYVFSIPGLTPKEVIIYKESTKLYLYSMS